MSNANQYYFLLVPLQLKLKGDSHTDQSRQYNYKLSLHKGQQKFDQMKCPVSVSGGKMSSILYFDRSQILHFFIPVFNENRKIDFQLKITGDLKEQSNYLQIGTQSIQSNTYINTLNSQQKAYFQETYVLGNECELKCQLFVGHTRQQCEKLIKERHPILFSPQKSKIDIGSASGRTKIYSTIGVSYTRGQTPNKYSQSQENFYRDTSNIRNQQLNSHIVVNTQEKQDNSKNYSQVQPYQPQNQTKEVNSHSEEKILSQSITHQQKKNQINQNSHQKTVEQSYQPNQQAHQYTVKINIAKEVSQVKQNNQQKQQVQPVQQVVNKQQVKQTNDNYVPLIQQSNKQQEQKTLIQQNKQQQQKAKEEQLGDKEKDLTVQQPIKKQLVEDEKILQKGSILQQKKQQQNSKESETIIQKVQRQKVQPQSQKQQVKLNKQDVTSSTNKIQSGSCKYFLIFILLILFGGIGFAVLNPQLTQNITSSFLTPSTPQKKTKASSQKKRKKKGK